MNVKKKAVCIWCGSWKGEPWSGCPKCGRTPGSNTEEEIKSVYLSLGGFDGGNVKDHRKALGKISEEIIRGEQVEYDDVELERLREQRRMVGQVKNKDIAAFLFKLVFPGLAFLIFMWLLVHFIRSLKG